MEFRIKEYNKGFVVEVKKKKCRLFYTKYYWTHFISVAGMNDEPWYHSSYKYAEMNLLNKIKWDTISNSN
jgi:hypothetical protein